MSNDYPIIPRPAKLDTKDGFFQLRPETVLIADDFNLENAAYLREFLGPPLGYNLPIQAASDHRRGLIALKKNPSLGSLGEEGYTLTVDVDHIEITAPSEKGVFYGIQTIRQLLPVEIENRTLVPEIKEQGACWQVPCCKIIDQPRFSWRGYMLDEGRHFQGKDTILQTIDLMALQKLNVLHWHLTEDQGWRVEVKRYPKLTEVGSQRIGTAHNWSDARKGLHDGTRHGGFYSQDEIRDIVAYAAQRNIGVVPEIDMPGHSRAAIAAYPDLSCTGASIDVPTRFGIFKDILCPGKESTFEFLEGVLDEIIELFPSKIIHIGGDEAPKARWKECPHCQQRIQEQGLADEHDLQVYFTNRIGNYLASHGRQLMGWNEILGANLDKDAIVQFWFRNRKGLVEAVQKGQTVVNSAYHDTYLDHSYSLTPLSRAYNFDPVLKGLDAESAQNILGLEAPMWTEWVPNRARLDYQVYPRLTALAEVGWTPVNRRDYVDFRRRLTTFNRRLDVHGVEYALESNWEPPWYQRLFGIFTIAQPQTRVREG